MPVVSMSEKFKPLGSPIRKPAPPKPDPVDTFNKTNHKFPDGRVQGNTPKHQMALPPEIYCYPFKFITFTGLPC